jgi:hypothetical protein
VGGAVVLASVVVPIVAGWLVGAWLLQLTLTVRVQTALVVADENGGGGVHGVDKDQCPSCGIPYSCR